MHDVALYGNLVFDTIIDGSKISNDVGGIVNVWKSLKALDQSVNVYVCPTEIGASVIRIDREKSERTSNSDLLQNQVIPFCEAARYNLVSYANELMSTAFMHHLEGLVCADICTGRSLDESLYQYIDYLFVSHEDLPLIDIHQVKGTLVVHSPRMSELTNKEGNYSYVAHPDDYIKNANVLGAGDNYAACFIYSKLQGKSDNDSMTYAHTMTTKWLRDKNAKN